MSTGLLEQVLVTGLAAGATYGLVALGIAQLYRMTGVLQLAHGHVVAVAVLVALAVLGTLGGGAATTTPVRAGLALLFAVVAAAAVSAAIPILGLGRALVRRTATGWIALVVALAFALAALLALVSPREDYAFPQVLPGGDARVALASGAAVSGRAVWQLGAGLALAVTLDGLMRWTRPGKALAAVASDPQLAEIVGLPVRSLVRLAFALAGGLAAVAGVLAASGRAVGTADGVELGLWGLAAAAVAGFGERWQVFAVALALGVAEAAIVALPAAGGGTQRLAPVLAATLPALAVLLVLVLHPPRAARDEAE